MIGAAQQLREDNKWVSLMVDNGAAAHVCPPCFATQFPLQQLEHGTGPQLRTVTSQHIMLCKQVCVTNHSEQQMSYRSTFVRLNSRFYQFQGWWNKVSNLLTLDDNPRLLHKQGQTGVIAPTTHTLQGTADTGHTGDFWQFNTKGEFVRVRRQHRKTFFTPARTPCPVPTKQVEAMGQRGAQQTQRKQRTAIQDHPSTFPRCL